MLDLDLLGKVAIVSGASRGIGEGIAVKLADHGMKLGLGGRDGGMLDGVRKRIESGGGEGVALVGDLAEESSALAYMAKVIERWGRIDLLVNSAGATPRGDFLQLTERDWMAGFGGKFFGAVRLCRAAWPHLSKTGGSIVNIAGVGGRAGSAEFTIGGSVNAGLMHLTKSLADRGVKDGVRVNCINPGAFRTKRLEVRIGRVMQRDGVGHEEAEKRLLGEMGVARFGEVEEIADAVAFLASARASYWQGAIIDIDGGWTRGM